MNTPEFLDYKESVKRLGIISENLRKILEIGNSYERLPLWCFWAALCGEMKMLVAINSELLNSALAWDRETKLPTHPSLAADAASAGMYLDGAGEKLKLILKSFSGWTAFCSEEIMCACGGRAFKKRAVSYDIYLNHALEKRNNELSIKQMVGIMSQDRGFLEKHFGWKIKSKGLYNTVIVYSSSNSITVSENGDIQLKTIKVDCAHEFFNKSEPNSFEFGRRIIESLKGGQ